MDPTDETLALANYDPGCIKWSVRPRSRMGAEYCDERVCVIVCLFICLSASISPTLHFQSIHLKNFNGRGSVLLWYGDSETLCTFVSMDGVLCLHNYKLIGREQTTGKTLAQTDSPGGSTRRGGVSTIALL